MNAASSDATADSYDDIPYPGAPCRYSHPDTLATAGLLAGLSPAPVSRCRVLELGCADGGNLIPMAYGLPGSEFIGIDLSRGAIEEGGKQAAALGLKNLHLECLSLMDLDERWGRFDYIITHGVYSWVPPEVQDRILELSRRLLNPQGLVYIDYNTYPGWHMRGMVREMLLFHTRKESEGAAKVSRARQFLEELAGKVGVSELATLTATDLAAYGAALRHEQAFLAGNTDAYLYHEHLEFVNQPLYFHEFAARAERQGLKYLSEGSFGSGRLENLPPDLAGTLRSISGDNLELQQYLDYTCNRTFRQSVLCRAEDPTVPEPDPLRFGAFYIASPAKPASAAPDLATFQVEVFTAPGGGTLSSGHPLVKAAMLVLSRCWPLRLKFEELVAAAQASIPPAENSGASRDLKGLGETLLQAHIRGLAELHAMPALQGVSIHERPEASRLARLQAGVGTGVVNLRHELVRLDEPGRLLVLAMDGSRNLEELSRVLGPDRAGEFRPWLERLAASALLLP